MQAFHGDPSGCLILNGMEVILSMLLGSTGKQQAKSVAVRLAMTFDMLLASYG